MALCDDQNDSRAAAIRALAGPRYRAEAEKLIRSGASVEEARVSLWWVHQERRGQPATMGEVSDTDLLDGLRAMTGPSAVPSDVPEARLRSMSDDDLAASLRRAFGGRAID
jgi:hypothetical protein